MSMEPEERLASLAQVIEAWLDGNDGIHVEYFGNELNNTFAHGMASTAITALFAMAGSASVNEFRVVRKLAESEGE